ncbi:ATP-binding protein [Streptomyces sp. NPDC051364]|uniref:ATP-binding protein n=1 Tax=Streptomyces sp. NPDC051364 TaxID=3155799 RepID=UPI003446C154
MSATGMWQLRACTFSWSKTKKASPSPCGAASPPTATGSTSPTTATAAWTSSTGWSGPTPGSGSSPPTPRAAGDPARLERALANLVDNALRHARTQVVVRAAAESTEYPGGAGWTVLEVEDDGPGIPAADRDRVFERFVRLDADRGRAGGGTGLGLPIVREIARAHGGEAHALPPRSGGPGIRLVLRLPTGGPGPATRSRSRCRCRSREF